LPEFHENSDNKDVSLEVPQEDVISTNDVLIPQPNVSINYNQNENEATVTSPSCELNWRKSLSSWPRDQFEDEHTTQGKMLVDDMRNAFNIELVLKTAYT
jgi:hypothetical protein